MKIDRLQKKWSEETDRRKRLSAGMKQALISKCPDVLKRYKVQKAILFGSLAAESADDKSDIDLLVQPLQKSRFWDLRFDLEEAVGHPIDLYTQDDDPVFVEKIRQRGEVIYEV